MSEDTKENLGVAIAIFISVVAVFLFIAGLWFIADRAADRQNEQDLALVNAGCSIQIIESEKVTVCPKDTNLLEEVQN